MGVRYSGTLTWKEDIWGKTTSLHSFFKKVSLLREGQLALWIKLSFVTPSRGLGRDSEGKRRDLLVGGRPRHGYVA